MVDKFESNLLDTVESDPEISGPEEPTSGKQKDRENPSIESLLDSREKGAREKPEKPLMRIPKVLF